jgi:hypothetical protein
VSPALWRRCLVRGDHDPPHPFMVVRDHGFLIDLSRVSGELWKGFLTRGRGFEPRIQDEIQSRKRSWTTLPRKIRRGEVK